MLRVLLLRILGPITLSMLSWELQFHACYLFTEDPRQIRQIQQDVTSWTCNQPTLPAVFTFFCLVCSCRLLHTK